MEPANLKARRRRDGGSRQRRRVDKGEGERDGEINKNMYKIHNYDLYLKVILNSLKTVFQSFLIDLRQTCLVANFHTKLQLKGKKIVFTPYNINKNGELNFVEVGASSGGLPESGF